MKQGKDETLQQVTLEMNRGYLRTSVKPLKLTLNMQSHTLIWLG